MKIKFCFFLSIYSRCGARWLLGPHDTLPCVLIHRWLPYNHKLAVPVPGLVEGSETQFFSIVPLGLSHTSQINATCVSIERRICDVT